MKKNKTEEICIKREIDKIKIIKSKVKLNAGKVSLTETMIRAKTFEEATKIAEEHDLGTDSIGDLTARVIASRLRCFISDEYFRKLKDAEE